MDHELYKIIYNRKLKVGRMEPSEYFVRLLPHEGIAELKSQIAKLNEELRQHQQVFMDDDGGTYQPVLRRYGN